MVCEVNFVLEISGNDFYEILSSKGINIPRKLYDIGFMDVKYDKKSQRIWLTFRVVEKMK